MRPTISLLVLLSLLCGVEAVTVFPHVIPNQWGGGFFANITLVTNVDLCGWEVTLEFNNVVQSIQPHTARVLGSQSNSQTYTVVDHTWNWNKPAGSDVNIQFNGVVASGLNMIITSATFTKTSRAPYHCAAVEQTTSQASSATTVSTTSQTTSPTTTTSDTTQDDSSDSSNFPIPITDQWNTGFNAHVCITTQVELCGWEVKIEFSHVVNSINGYNCKLETSQSNSATYYIINESWTKSVSAGGQVCLHFGATKSNGVPAISVVNMVITKTSREAGTCPGQQQVTTQADTTSATTSAQTTTTADTTSATTSAQTTTTADTTSATTSAQTTTTADTTSATTSSGDGSTTSATTPSGSTSNSYLEVLSKSILFYEAQRSGDLPDSNRISWRGDSCLDDGSDSGVDLTGGWFDAGDHVKFNFPMAWSTTVLTWGLIQFKEGYVAAGELDNMYDSIRWPLDYLLKCWDAENQVYWAQVGDGGADHAIWTRPELMSIDRPSFKLTTQKPGSDVTAETAAAFAAASIAFETEDSGYSAILLDKAKSLYDFAYNYRATYHSSIPQASFYQSYSGYNDELCWGAAWLYKATGDSSYKDKANEFIGSSHNEFSWDSKLIGCQLLMYEADPTDTTLRSKVQNFMSHWMTSVSTTPTCKLAWSSEWSPLRYSANAALIGLIAADVGIETTRYREWSLSQIDYMLGANEQDRSYVVGWGINPPQRPHHRSSSCSPVITDPCSWVDYESSGPNPSTLNGALVGGPYNNGDYTDARDNFKSNEVACDYNAGFQSALAGLGKLSSESNFPSHTNPCCDSTLDFCQV